MNNELYHHGVKGMKWGIRKRYYENPDGTLTDAGRKAVSEEYKKRSNKVMAELESQYQDMYANAWNKSANKMNNGGAAEFNAKWEKEHGPDSFDDEYEARIMEYMDKEFVKNFNKSLAEFYVNSESYKSAQDLVKAYDMTKWDSRAKQNGETIAELMREVKGYK